VCEPSAPTSSCARADQLASAAGRRSSAPPFPTLIACLGLELCLPRRRRFRVLDEFDVFMDDTYRKIAVHTLLELCEKQPHRQFIFLTPQDMHLFLKDYKDQPRVIKMSDVR